jgi:hypothetical protein
MQAGKWLAIDRGSTLEVEAVQEIPVPPAVFPLAERITESQLLSLFRFRQMLPSSREQENGLSGDAQQAGTAGCIC